MKKKLAAWSGIGIAVLLFSGVISLSMGSAQLPIGEVWRILVAGIPRIGSFVEATWPASSESIVLQVRFPRLVLSILVGAALSVAGAGFQGVLRNPLADPFTLGVASGASVGAAFIILFGLQTIFFGQWTIPLAAFTTGVISLLLVLRLANIQGKLRTETVILAGVVIQAFLGSVVSFMIAMSKQTFNQIIFWQMGSLAFRGWEFSGLLFPYFVVGFLVLIGFSRALNLFALGERQAAHLGVNIQRTKVIVLVTATLDRKSTRLNSSHTS